MQFVPFELSIKAPAGLLNVSYGMNNAFLEVLASLIKAGLQPIFPLDKDRFQYFA
jgi:hypothetical protein